MRHESVLHGRQPLGQACYTELFRIKRRNNSFQFSLGLVRATLIAITSLLLLSGCEPGLVIHLYNATEETLSVTNPLFRRVITIPPHAIADVGAIGGGVLIRSARHSWFYPRQKSAFPPISFSQQHTMLCRAFGRIDSRGRIYLLAPPQDDQSPHETAQPAGFPLQPQKT
jgi:hypothetical protein